MFKHRIVRGVLFYTAVFLLLALLPGLASAEQDEFWTAKYWNNTGLGGSPVLVRQEDEINHNWGNGSPAGQVNRDYFSAQWKRKINLPAGTYRFTATMDDGMQVWVAGQRIIDDWRDGEVRSISADIQLPDGDHDVLVKYYEAWGGAIARLTWAKLPTPGPESINHWRGEYFNNMSLTPPASIIRDDAEINFDWGLSSPVPGTIQENYVSIRWTNNIQVTSGTYRFTVTADDGVRLWVNNQLLIDQWLDQGATTYSADIYLQGGWIPVRMEYYENRDYAVAKLSWAPASGTITPIPPPVNGPNSGAVTAYWLNVRSGPGVSYNILTTIGRGTVVTLTHRDYANTWVRAVLPNGVTGWVHSYYLNENVPVSSLPSWTG